MGCVMVFGMVQWMETYARVGVEGLESARGMVLGVGSGLVVVCGGCCVVVWRMPRSDLLVTDVEKGKMVMERSQATMV